MNATTEADRLFERGELIEAQARRLPRGPARDAKLAEARRLIEAAADLLEEENARLRAQTRGGRHPLTPWLG